ncbi:unnamed protein product, partial [Prorocentrum cordatum]
GGTSAGRWRPGAPRSPPPWRAGCRWACSRTSSASPGPCGSRTGGAGSCGSGPFSRRRRFSCWSATTPTCRSGSSGSTSRSSTLRSPTPASSTTSSTTGLPPGPPRWTATGSSSASCGPS